MLTDWCTVVFCNAHSDIYKGITFINKTLHTHLFLCEEMYICAR